MRHLSLVWVIMLLSVLSLSVQAQELRLSEQTEECLGCHSELHPGLVASWMRSRHSKVSPAEALQKPELQRRVSSVDIETELQQTAVGCYECHSLRTDQHADSFDHNGFQINIIVSPADCATCHVTEADQYTRNIMSHAYGNLVDNTLYRDLTQVVNNHYSFTKEQLTIGAGDKLTEYESCLYCHGTKVEVTGIVTRDTDFGELDFPVLDGWPNQGVGRINPDGSKGACTSCHSRHAFSIEMARKPFTCSECHKGPDVPAYKVYEVSKHGNIFNLSRQNLILMRYPGPLEKILPPRPAQPAMPACSFQKMIQ